MSYYVTDKDGNLIEVAGSYTPEEIEMFLTAHPIGSYFISQYSTSPAELYGGGWEEIDAGKTLWTIPTSETGAGEIIEAGLPNITGQLDFSSSVGFPSSSSNVNGSAITRRFGSRDNYIQSSKDAANRTHGIEFNANRNNSIYRDDVTTVQPPAIKVYMWRRYA